MAKLYTKTGDDGTTGLVGGSRVSKGCDRIAAMGAVDELNCVLGEVIALAKHSELSDQLERLQHNLFDLGAALATERPSGGSNTTPSFDSHIAALEQAIDRFIAQVPPLERFILPGGTEVAARLHTARAVCRRAEQRCVLLNETEPIDNNIVVYLNRLSDLLFIMARRANQLDGVEDIPWNGLA